MAAVSDLECLVLEAGPKELAEIGASLPKPSLIFSYSQALLAYWNGRAEDLQVERLDRAGLDSQSFALIKELTRLRHAVRTFRAESQPPRPPSEDLSALWRGEWHFVAALYYETFDRDALALDHYRSAQRLFQSSGAARKGAKAYHNSVACLSRIDPHRRLINEYQLAVQWSKEAHEWPTVGAALNNLSREFHLMGATSFALKTSYEAVDVLRSHAYGSYSFALALCHRCHLHLEKKLYQRALLDFQEASASSLPEVQAALSVLREKLGDVEIPLPPSPEAVDLEKLRPKTWTERKNGFLLNSSSELSDSENKLIELLTPGASDRYALIQEIWGDREDFFVLENRFKQLLHRVRKKQPDVIGFADGKYFLFDQASTGKR